MADVVVVGGGIVGCALAAFLAEGGADVTLHERTAIAAGASGRNSGIVQHPMDPVLAPLFHETVHHYREVPGFALPEEPNGVLVLGEDADALRAEAAALRAGFPELGAEVVDAVAVEPAVAPGLAGLRLHTGYAVPPTAATEAFAARARAAGARIVIGDDAPPRADVTVLTAGPWTPALADPAGAWRPITPLWGVVAEVRLPHPPRHAVEEHGIDALIAGGDGGTLFSLVTAGAVSALGSTFLPEEPDPAAWAARLQERGARFVPVLAGARIAGLRACARPRSVDGRPFLGRRGDVFVAAGHGAWGISLGPASARLVADAVLGRAPAIPAELAAAR